MAPQTQEDPAPRPLPEIPSPPQLPPPEHSDLTWIRAVRRAAGFIIGPARRLTDPHLFHKISLAAFLAWVGLGADGLSSSAYGPEAAFLALQGNVFLAIPLALLTAITVSVIAASYMHIIERFPSGGGGYVVASKLLGPTAGLVSGSALIVDYVLTVAISLASCSDYVFSLFPPELQPFKLITTLCLLAVLTTLNLRGMKESVLVISPIFLAFVVTHGLGIASGIFLHHSQIPAEVHALRVQSSVAVGQTGWLPLLFILFHAFTLGGGTYTGIEAVSNGIPLLRDPKAATAKRTMRYMAASLALVASGILVCYLLYQVHPVPGKTLNAVLWQAVAGQIFPPGSHLGQILVAITLLSSAGLLFVAAQAGFADGPRVLSNMALDRWVPSRFASLSERLVTAKGIAAIALAAGFVILGTGGAVDVLVVLYSINVFLTFSLSQLSMCRDALHLRREGRSWRGALAISATGFALTSSLLIGTVLTKFREGGWATLLATALICAMCVLIRRHYAHTALSLKRLDESLLNIPLPPGEPTQAPLKKTAPTAILTVTSFGGLGVHTLLNLFRIFPNQFRQIVFVSVAAIDSGQFKGMDEIDALRANTEAELKKCVEYARKLGIPADSRYAVGTDIVEELENLCVQVNEEYPKSVALGGQLVFQKERTAVRWLHNQTCPALQRRLAFHGLPMVILPVRVY